MNAGQEGVYVITFAGTVQEEYTERGGRLRLHDSRHAATFYVTPGEAFAAIGREIVAGGATIAREGFRVIPLSVGAPV